MDSILTSIKKRLGIAEEYEDFDEDIIMPINTAFSTLTQLGAGPKRGFRISSDQEVWTDFISEDSVILGFVKDYIYYKARLSFDPPTSSSLIDVMERSAKELEDRIKIEAETPSVEPEVEAV